MLFFFNGGYLKSAAVSFQEKFARCGLSTKSSDKTLHAISSRAKTLARLRKRFRNVTCSGTHQQSTELTLTSTWGNSRAQSVGVYWSLRTGPIDSARRVLSAMNRRWRFFFIKKATLRLWPTNWKMVPNLQTSEFPNVTLSFWFFFCISQRTMAEFTVKSTWFQNEKHIVLFGVFLYLCGLEDGDNQTWTVSLQQLAPRQALQVWRSFDSELFKTTRSFAEQNSFTPAPGPSVWPTYFPELQLCKSQHENEKYNC